MSRSELHARAMRLFDEVCDLPIVERAAWLDAHCRDDAVRREVESLLASDDATGPIADDVEHGAGAARLAAEVADALTGRPERIGRYRVLREIGQGGMGIVYEAEQDEPRRRVAVKVVRQAFSSPQLIRRFHREADALGRLDHPGIAHIYEAGSAQLGGSTWPYFAMEFIDGRRLDEHARTADLDRRQRLELFARVCDAVHHAHQKGVIHRDLKPANILVKQARTGTGDDRDSRSGLIDAIGQPKILDFGVARVNDDDARSITLQTHAGQLVGTLAYMSPEQIAGEAAAIDTRTDVYALGVLLFELLTGQLPHDVRGKPIAEAARVIREDPPTRVSRHDATLAGDVATIVSKAIEKSPRDRYGSAADLASDIRRFLADEPIAARPASALYQLGKFARRNRTLVGGIAATLFAVVLGACGAVWFGLAANRAKTDAQESAARSERATLRASLAAGAAALRENDIAMAERRLDDAPPHLRGWAWRHLESQLDESMHTVPIEDRATLDATTIRRGFARVWFDQDGRRIHTTLARHVEQVLGVRTLDADGLSPETAWTRPGLTAVAPVAGGRLVASSRSTPVQLLHVRDGAPAGQVRGALSGRQGRNLFIGHVPAAVVDGSADAPADAIAARPGGFAFTRDGRRMLSARQRVVTVDMVDANGVAETLTLEEHLEGISGAVFRDDGRFVITAGYNRRLAMFDLDDSGRRVWETPDAHDDAILAVAISPDGATLATGGQDRVLRIWDARDGRPLGVLSGHRDPVLAICFAPDGASIVTRSAATLKRWDVRSLSRPDILRHEFFVATVAVDPTGSLLATGSMEVVLRDLASGEFVARVPSDANHVHHVSFSSDGHRLAIVGGGGAGGRLSALVIDTRSGREFQRASGALAYGPGGLARLREDRFELLADDFSVGEQFPVDAGRLRHDLAGRHIVAWRNRVFVPTVYARPEGTPLWTRDDLMADSAQFLSDGRTIGMATIDNDIVLLDVETGVERGRLSGHSGTVGCLAEIPAERLLVSGAQDRTVRLWDLATLEEVADLRGHTDAVRDIAVTGDGTTFFSASNDYTVRRWTTSRPADLIAARDAYAAIVARLAPRVTELFATAGDADEVARALADDASLTPRERQVAMQLTLRRALDRAALPKKLRIRDRAAGCRSCPG